MKTKKPIMAATYKTEMTEKVSISTSVRRKVLLTMFGAEDGTLASVQRPRNVRRKVSEIVDELNVQFENRHARLRFEESISEAYCLFLRVVDNYIERTDNVTNHVRNSGKEIIPSNALRHY